MVESTTIVVVQDTGSSFQSHEIIISRCKLLDDLRSSDLLDILLNFFSSRYADEFTFCLYFICPHNTELYYWSTNNNIGVLVNLSDVCFEIHVKLGHVCIYSLNQPGAHVLNP
jgi:hypothetical protein